MGMAKKAKTAHRKPSKGGKASGKAKARYKNPVMDQKQFEKELKALRNIHSLADHKKEQKVLREVQKHEWLHIPDDKEIKKEIDSLMKGEAKARSMLEPQAVEFEPLPSSKELLKIEKRQEKVSKRKKASKKNR